MTGANSQIATAWSTSEVSQYEVSQYKENRIAHSADWAKDIDDRDWRNHDGDN
jgi:hypothetical protein